MVGGHVLIWPVKPDHALRHASSTDALTEG